MTLELAIQMVKAAGYRVTKPKSQAHIAWPNVRRQVRGRCAVSHDYALSG
jgi:hypothetical protein